MYHDVTAAPEWRSGGTAFFSVTDTDFQRHLDLVASLGLRGCSIAQALANPRDAIAISFDDGDLGQAARAFPALAARKMSATFFVTTSWIGTPRYASWDQLREMRAAGMSIESHTHTHPFLSQLDAESLRDELRRSRELLDERLEQRTTMLALPGGDAPRADLWSVVAEEGFPVIATSRWGRNGPAGDGAPRLVKRCTVRGAPSDAAFVAIASGDRWLSFRKQARERVLAFARASLGPTRYARWRRVVLGGQ
jgi:peptidoglycan/xylan/chitin deacetylase (PgdA/CDA1 family)